MNFLPHFRSSQGINQPQKMGIQKPIVPIQPSFINQAQTANSTILIDSLINVDPTVTSGIDITTPVTSNAIPAPPTPPSGTRSHPMSVSEKAPSIESPGPATNPITVEWAIKGPQKLKYTQLFNTTDRTRSGYLTGAQARNLLLQSTLPQATLAQVWALADIDSDGRLSCDEFLLAMHLCEIASQGEQIPAKLPPDLIPPTFRKNTSRHGSVSASGANSRHGSISSQSGSAVNVDLDALHSFNQNTFEDKRKENFDKGQAELERRRKVLQGNAIIYVTCEMFNLFTSYLNSKMLNVRKLKNVNEKNAKKPKKRKRLVWKLNAKKEKSWSDNYKYKENLNKNEKRNENMNLNKKRYCSEKIFFFIPTKI